MLPRFSDEEVVTMRRVFRGWWVGLLLVPSALQAQTDPKIAAPPVLPNYQRMPVGEREALEAGAYIARTNDANANWYNPAGISLVEQTSANLSASAYEATTLELASLRQKTSNLRLSPLSAFFGLAIAKPLTSSNDVRYGFFIARPIAWQSGTLDEAAPLNPQTVFAGTSEATLTRLEPGLVVGVRVNERFRVGGSLGVSVTTLDMTQDFSLRYADADSSSTTRRTLSVGGTSWHLVPRVGVQWDAGERWKIGVVAAAPGVQLMGSASTSFYSGTYASEDRYIDVSFRDEEADFEYALPFTAGVGIAWTYSRGSIEGVVRYYGASDEYDMIMSTLTSRRVDAIGGVPPAIVSSPVAPIENSWRDVTNFALGGNYGLSDAVRLHFGFNTDSSPVDDPNRSMYRKVDLMGGTAGVSYQGTTFGASLGLGYSAGNSDPISQIAGLSGTRLEVSTFRAMYSFSARF
jgi:long-subunit fatty acid transport protein